MRKHTEEIAAATIAVANVERSRTSIVASRACTYRGRPREATARRASGLRAYFATVDLRPIVDGPRPRAQDRRSRKKKVIPVTSASRQSADQRHGSYGTQGCAVGMGPRLFCRHTPCRYTFAVGENYVDVEQSRDALPMARGAGRATRWSRHAFHTRMGCSPRRCSAHRRWWNRKSGDVCTDNHAACVSRVGDQVGGASSAEALRVGGGANGRA